MIIDRHAGAIDAEGGSQWPGTDQRAGDESDRVETGCAVRRASAYLQNGLPRAAGIGIRQKETAASAREIPVVRYLVFGVVA